MLAVVDAGAFPLPHQLASSSRAPQPIASVPPALEFQDPLILQLTHLASQHHWSEYSRLKFGARGCQIPYVPLSLQYPEHVADLQMRQAECNRQQAWFPCPSAPSSPCILETTTNAVAELELALLAAMDAPLETPLQTAQYSLSQIKTSESHPINISMLIPPELLPLISSHLNPRLPPYPTLFTIPVAYTLDRITSAPSPYQVCLPPPPPPPQSALRTPPASLSRARARGAISQLLFKRGLTRENPLAPRRLEDDVDTPRPSSPASTCSEKVSTPSTTPTLQIPRPNIGNLFLSSCPGKKIRLSGPVKGRAGVCRDLTADLRRMRDLGVGCIICCLDDTELAFLGAPWPEYASAAAALGLAVLRLPMPEGLAPLSVRALDDALRRVIEAYTLRGVHVLVHCRGGVGRAGLVACCWTVRLGLAGWLPRGRTNEAEVEGDVVRLVERVIALMRRRRSVKAIETYEQVRFLVEYVQYLRAREAEADMVD